MIFVQLNHRIGGKGGGVIAMLYTLAETEFTSCQFAKIRSDLLFNWLS